MNQQQLQKAALMVSVAGLIFLFLIAKKIEVNDTTINKIMQGQESDIILEGVVKNVRPINGGTVLLVTTESDINVVSFGESLPLSTGDYVRVRGKASENDIIADYIQKK
jgi:hypothetical protein